MNLSKAITLLKTLSDFPYILPEKKPHFSIFGRPDNEYVLVGKTKLVHEEYPNYVKKIAELHTLRIEESNGLMVIYDPWVKYLATSNLFGTPAFFFENLDSRSLRRGIDFGAKFNSQEALKLGNLCSTEHELRSVRQRRVGKGYRRNLKVRTLQERFRRRYCLSSNGDLILHTGGNTVKKVKPMEITKEQFLAFEEVRLSGVTNMTAIEDIKELSGLTHQQIQVIMKFQDELKKKYVNREGTH